MKLPGCFHLGQRVHQFEEENEASPGAEESKQWRRCGLQFSEICEAELVPDAFIFSTNHEEVMCAWIRSQIIGSRLEIQTPFGKRRITYADYTASGRCLLHIENYLVNHVMPYYGNTHTEDSYVGRTMSHLVKESKRFIKQCLGGTENDALIFCGSGTTAAIKRLQEIMGLSVSSVLREELIECTNKTSYVVFVGPYEHHSNLLSWRQSLAEVIQVPMDEQGLIDLDFLEEALQDPSYAGRPKLGSFSACSNVTGILTDTRRIARLLHEHGAFACFDFASSGPYVEIDMRSGEPDGYDAIFLSPHKFVGGPGTPGVLLMSKKMYKIQQRAPTTAGGGVVDFVNFSEKDTLYVKDIEERENAGTPQILQQIKAAMAFWIKEEAGTQMIEIRERKFIRAALQRLSMNPNIQILGNTEVERQAILSFLVFDGGRQRGKVLQARFVVKLLSDLFGIQARGGCSCASPYGHALLEVDDETSLRFRDALAQGLEGMKLGWCRVSFPYFMSNEEFLFILDSIEFIARYGERFVQLYDFDWESGNWTMKQNTGASTMKKPKPMLSKSKLSMTMPQRDQFKLYLDEARAMANNTLQIQHQQLERRLPENVDRSLINFRL